MDKELEILIETRCDNALLKNKEYLRLQDELAQAHIDNNIDAFSEISYRMQRLAVKYSYQFAIKDMFSIINN